MTVFASDDELAADLRRLAAQLRKRDPAMTRALAIEELERLAQILKPKSHNG